MSRSRLAVWMIWVVASLFYAYQYVLRVMPSIMLTDIMDKFSIDAAMFGQFSGIYYIGYSLVHLPVGILLDRFGPKKVMSSCILLTVAGLSPLVFSEHWIYPILGRLLIGIGSSAAILGVFKIIRMTFAEERFPRMLSLSVMIGLLGAIYGGGPVHYLRETLGYEQVLYLFAAAGVVLALLTYWIVPDSKESSKATIFADLKEVMGNHRVLLTCLFAGLMIGPLEGFADVWGKAFLKNVFGINETVAASLPSLIFIGMCFGSPLLSFIAEKIGNYLVAIIGAGFVMLGGFLLLLTSGLSIPMVSINFVLIGIACAYQILALYKASTYVPERVAGMTTAVANMIVMIFGYCFHSIIGRIVEAFGGPDSPSALYYGTAVIPAALMIGTLGFTWLYLQEKKKPSLEF